MNILTARKFFKIRSFQSLLRLRLSFFHSLNFNQGNFKKNSEKLIEANNELNKLNKIYSESGFFEKFRFKQIILKKQNEINALKSIELLYQEIGNPIIELDENKDDDLFIETTRIRIFYLINRFFEECQNDSRRFYLKENPDLIINNIKNDFVLKHKKFGEINREYILTFFHVFFLILNNIINIKDLKFQNEKVMKILKIYSDNENSKVNIEEICNFTGFDETNVKGWIDIFNNLSNIPRAKDFVFFTCTLCPLEYNSYNELKSQLNFFKNRNSDLKQENDFVFKTPFNTKKNSNFFKSNDQNNKKIMGQKNFQIFQLNSKKLPTYFFQLILLSVFLLYLIFKSLSFEQVEITFQDFVSLFLFKNVVSQLVVMSNNTVAIEFNQNGSEFQNKNYFFNIGSVELFENNLSEIQNQYGVSDYLNVPVIYKSNNGVLEFIINLLPTFLFLGSVALLSSRTNIGNVSGPFSIGKSIAKKFNQENNVKFKFKDVAGMREVKQEVYEFVEFLRNPKKFEVLGAKIPKGAILSGPPGVGKTLIAKAIAGESNVPFYSVSGSEFIEVFVGVGASRVRDLFKTARENAPSIIFLDEIDAIGKSRSRNNLTGSNDERETTLNQLLVEMDGFDSSNHVVVFAGTNRLDILDKALLRPGRFDRNVSIDLPELSDRKEIFDIHLKKVKLHKDIGPDLSQKMADLTSGFSGADIANVCNESALTAARLDSSHVTFKHLEFALDRVIAGVERKSKILSDHEKKIIAYHEAGHVICSWYLEHASPLQKVTIIPRGNSALGYTQYLHSNNYLLTNLQLYDKIIMIMGGRVSEELNFSSVSTGAHDDFKKATNIAKSMVMRFGMSKKIGYLNYADVNDNDSLTKPFSDETNKSIDSEVQLILSNCYNSCLNLLKSKKNELILVAQELLKKESITNDDVKQLLGERSFVKKKN